LEDFKFYTFFLTIFALFVEQATVMKISFSLTFILLISVVCLQAQDDLVFPFERVYPSNSEKHLTLDLDSLPGGGFLGLAIEKNENERFRRMNVTSFDTKGNINWTKTIEYKRDYDLLPIGDIIRIGDDSIAFSAVLDTVAYQRVLTKMGRDGGYGWSKVYHTEGQIENVLTGRSELNEFVGESMFHITNVDKGASTDLLVSIVDTLGNILITKTINASSEPSEQDIIIDAQTTLDSGVIVLSNTSSNVVITKMNKFGDISWMKSYESPLDNTSSVEATNFVELVNGDIAIAASINLTNSTSDNLILHLSGDGDVITGYNISALNESINIREIGGRPDTTIVYSGFKSTGFGQGEPYIAQLRLDSTVGWNSFSHRSLDREIMGFTSTTDGGAAAFVSGGTNDATEIETPYLVRYDDSGMRNGACFAQEMNIQLAFSDIIVSDVDFQEEIINGLSDTISVKDEDYEGFNPPILSLPDTAYCPQDPINFELDATIEHAIGYLWSSNVRQPAPIVTAREEGMYSVTITVSDEFRITCFTLCDTANVVKKDLPEVQIAPNFVQYCETGEAILSAMANNPIVDIEWSTGVTQETRIGVTSPGTYRVTIVDDCGNEAQASLGIGQADFDVELPLTGRVDDTFCSTGSVRVRLEGFNANPAGLTWSNGASGVTSINVDEPGTYSVTYDGFCPGFAEIEVSSNFFIDPGTIDIDLTCGTNTAVLISSEERISSRVWSTGAISSSLIVTTPGTYTVTGTDLCGDMVTAEIEVTTEDLINCGVDPGVSGEPCMEFPNAFVPNSRDEMNRTFAPKSDCSDLVSYELRIYNRWGGEVFKSNQVDLGWDGRKGSNDAPADVYFFYSIYDTGGVEFEEKGDLLLIR